MRITDLNVDSRRQMLVLVAVVAIAYLPSLFCGFVYDDHRFVEDNDAVANLSPKNIVRYFTDQRTVAFYGWDGIYRPIRTFDFAVDWTISGGQPWFFHLKNMLYHALGAILLLLLFRELSKEREGGGAEAFAGALFFAVHPVNTEVVAWVTSRGDLHVFVLVVLGLLLHVRGRPALTALVMVPMLLAKESAVVFVGAAFLCDRVRGSRPRFGWYAVYGGLALVYTLLWFKFLARGQADGMGHLPYYWGGSYGANLLTMSQGFLHYLGQMLVPTGLVIDYHVPSIARLTPGSAISIAVLAAVAIGCVAGGRRSRFALLWFLVLLFPVSNLLIKVGIPTAERFLYLPLVGLAFLLAPLLARSRLTVVLLVCFGALTFARTLDWRSDDALWAAAEKVAPTPRGLSHRVATEIRKAHAIREEVTKLRSPPSAEMIGKMRAHAQRAVNAADQLLDLYDRWIGLDPGDIGGLALSMKANALVVLGRPEDALAAADRSIGMSDEPAAYFNAALALEALGRVQDAAINLETAKRKGYTGGGDLTTPIAQLWYRAGAIAEQRGDVDQALAFYRRSWATLPDTGKNPGAAAALDRLGRPR